MLLLSGYDSAKFMYTNISEYACTSIEVISHTISLSYTLRLIYIFLLCLLNESAEQERTKVANGHCEGAICREATETKGLVSINSWIPHLVI